ncbi:MAG: hypothetical protein ACPGXK_08265 [Phycisphaerae bacterium]
MSPADHEHSSNLGPVLEKIWDQLEEAVTRRAHSFHLPVLTTIGLNGIPDARVVVLRSAARQHCCISCHTDSRSPKAIQLVRCAHATWVFYDHQQRIQVRVSGQTSIAGVDGSEAAINAWNNVSQSERQSYLGPHPPSQRASQPTSNLPAGMPGRAPTEQEIQFAKQNFRLITTHINRIDWLWLRDEGHRRAMFEWDESGRSSAHWLEP